MYRSQSFASGSLVARLDGLRDGTAAKEGPALITLRRATELREKRIILVILSLRTSNRGVLLPTRSCCGQSDDKWDPGLPSRYGPIESRPRGLLDERPARQSPRY